MTFWMLAGFAVAVAGVGSLLWLRRVRGNLRAQDPQNIYPLW